MYGVFGYILYRHSVVGSVIYFRSVIYGARTHSARRYRCDFSVLQLYKYINAIRNGDQFFAGEVEIFDFVTERAKRCIAAKRENRWNEFCKTQNYN